MVEWKKLGEISSLVRGKVISKDFIRDHKGFFPVYSSQTANNGILGYIDSYMFDGNYLTWTTDGAYAGTVFRRSGRFNITNVCGLIKLINEKVNQDFLFYWLSYTAKDYVIEGMGNPKLMSNVASTILIPIPSLAKQERIVGILDTFTASIDNLKAQIAQRRKQLEFYRNQLLDLEGKPGVEMIAMKDLFTIKNGYTPSKNHQEYWDGGTIPWFRMEDIRQNGTILKDSIQHITPLGVKKGGLFPANSIIVATTATIGEHALIIVDSLANQRFTFLTKCKSYDSKLDMKYMYYYMFIVDEWCKKNTNVSGFASVDMDKFKKLLIPIPSLSEQQRIVSTLDTFEANITNLEAQLAQRQKQYEYYRNKLLTFE